jgi:hypothetical protein
VCLDEEESTYGGIYVCKLQVTDVALLTAESALRVVWTDMFGTRRSEAVPLNLQVSVLDAVLEEELDIGLRKAVVLVDYVQLLTAFAMESNMTTRTTSAGTEMTIPNSLSHILIRSFKIAVFF